MLKAFIKGEAALRRNKNCSYTESDIMASNCSNYAYFPYDEVRGTCSKDGICLCNDGFTGVSDWLNLDTLDCQVNSDYSIE